MNYFQLFEISPKYFIDIKELEKKFYELSRKMHPDKFQTKGLDEIKRATESYALLNKAFATLKDPDDRAQYIFGLAQFKVSDSKKTLPPELAEEYFNLQEALEDDSQSENTKNLVKEFSLLVKNQVQSQNQFQENAFKEWDNLKSPINKSAFPLFTKASHAILQKNYLKSMAQDLERKFHS